MTALKKRERALLRKNKGRHHEKVALFMREKINKLPAVLWEMLPKNVQSRIKG